MQALVNEFDPQADDDWEYEMGMAPEVDFTADGPQPYDADVPFPRSPSPEIERPIRSPSVEIIAHHRSPSVEIMADNRAPAVVPNPPPASQPVGSNNGYDQLATGRELDVWATSVRSQSLGPSRNVFGGHPARIHAKTAAAAAEALFAVLVHILQKADGKHKTFQAPPGVTVCEKSVNVTSFTRLDCDLRV